MTNKYNTVQYNIILTYIQNYIVHYIVLGYNTNINTILCTIMCYSTIYIMHYIVQIQYGVICQVTLYNIENFVHCNCILHSVVQYCTD